MNALPSLLLLASLTQTEPSTQRYITLPEMQASLDVRGARLSGFADLPISDASRETLASTLDAYRNNPSACDGTREHLGAPDAARRYPFSDWINGSHDYLLVRLLKSTPAWDSARYSFVNLLSGRVVEVLAQRSSSHWSAGDQVTLRHARVDFTLADIRLCGGPPLDAWEPTVAVAELLFVSAQGLDQPGTLRVALESPIRNGILAELPETCLTEAVPLAHVRDLLREITKP